MKTLTFNIPYKSSLKQFILGYGAHLKDNDEYIIEYTSDNEEINENNNIITNLKLSYGKHDIPYKNNIITINYMKENNCKGLSYTVEYYETLSLHINYMNDKKEKEKVLQNFILDAEKYFNISSNNEVICHILNNDYWKILSKLPKRSIDTIDLPKKDIEYIINDISNFYNNEKEYMNLGIPWKRNYLLEGLPGTGKTSLIFSLASHFNLDIYIINLGPKIDDSGYMKVVSKLPKKAILVLEDVDALFVERKKNDSQKSLVSFSGILNVLDGMARKDGLITFLTTNYKNRLDKALIRPSRIDYILHFKEATEEQIKHMFKRFFPNEDSDNFYKKVEFLKLRTCVLQQFLMEVKFNNVKLSNISRLKKIIKEMNNDIVASSIYQ